MRVILSIVGVFAFLSAVAVILLYMAGQTAHGGESTAIAVIGCLIVGAVSLNWAQGQRAAGGKKASGAK